MKNVIFFIALLLGNTLCAQKKMFIYIEQYVNGVLTTNSSQTQMDVHLEAVHRNKKTSLKREGSVYVYNDKQPLKVLKISFG